MTYEELLTLREQLDGMIALFEGLADIGDYPQANKRNAEHFREVLDKLNVRLSVCEEPESVRRSRETAEAKRELDRISYALTADVCGLDTGRDELKRRYRETYCRYCALTGQTVPESKQILI